MPDVTSRPRIRIAVLFAGLLMVSAGATQHGYAANGEQASSVKSVLDVPPPPGLGEDDLYEKVREVKRRGPATLDDVLAEIDPPAYLKAAPEQDETDEPDAAPPLEAQRAYAAGRLAMRSGARFEALRQLQSAARLAPEHAEIRDALGELLAAAGDVRAAIGHLEKAVELDPLRSHALYLLGKAAVQDNRYAEATALLHAAIERAPRDPRTDSALPLVARYQLAAALTGLNRPAAAAEQLERFHAEPRETTHISGPVRELSMLDRRRDRTHRFLGDLYLRLDRPADALRQYRMAAERSPGDVRLADRLLYAELLAGRQDRAQDVALALFREPRHRQLGVTLLNYLRERGVSTESLLAELQQAYENARRDTGTALALAELLPTEQARDHLRQHLSHRPEDTAVLAQLLRLTLGQTPDDDDVLASAKALASLLAEHPRQSPAWAEIFFRILDDDPRAARVLTQHIDAEPADTEPADAEHAQPADHQPELAALTGIALARAGRSDDARTYLENALSARPELTASRVILAQIAAGSG
ncbi:MAG: tetratricopeptide repeat protein, partial [Phycisphaeraceae bacterium]